MRTKNGKGLAPCQSLRWHVFALAALLAAGLVTLFPSGAQAPICNWLGAQMTLRQPIQAQSGG